MVVQCPGFSNEFDPLAVFQRILVPIDFTPESRRALIAACALRTRFGSELHLFVESGHGQTGGLRGLGVDWGSDGVVRDAEQMLRYFSESICKGMPCVAKHATFGEDVVAGIADAAKACGATLVVMGTHDQRTPWRTRVERILRQLDVPVLLLQHAEKLAGTAPEPAGKEPARAS